MLGGSANRSEVTMTESRGLVAFLERATAALHRFVRRSGDHQATATPQTSRAENAVEAGTPSREHVLRCAGGVSNADFPDILVGGKAALQELTGMRRAALDATLSETSLMAQQGDSHAGVLTLLGYAALALGRLTDFQGLFQQTISARPYSPSGAVAAYFMAVIAGGSGDGMAARRALEQAALLSSDPGAGTPLVIALFVGDTMAFRSGGLAVRGESELGPMGWHTLPVR
jgi:hypothetical protein